MNTVDTNFERTKNRKALVYTIMVCAVLFLLFIIISWKVAPPTIPLSQDLIEINLGNNEEGFGDIQPLIKGERNPTPDASDEAVQASAPAPEQDQAVTADENAEENAAPVTKTVKTTKPKINPTPTPVTKPTPKQQKPKFTYNGPGKGNGNNDTEDNGYKNQGNNPGGRGDAGDPSGNKDSYGNTPGGKVGGIRVTSGNRKIVRFYSFTGDLPKATIFANIKVSPEGKGHFVQMVKPSTSYDKRYATAIVNYLSNMQFDKAKDESLVTVQFNFNIN